MAKVLVITSGKGGVGKTTTAINLGAAMNSMREDVLIVDANLTTPNVGLHLGAPIVPISLNHVLSGKARVEEAIYEHESGTRIIPSSLSVKELEKIKTSKLDNKLQNLVKKLRKISEYIIFDSAAGLGAEALSAISLADEIIIVTNPELPAVTDALKTIKVAEDMGKHILGVIITRVKFDKTEMPIADIKEMLEVPILGIIPEDRAIKESQAKRNAVIHTNPKSKSARAYKNIAAKLTGKTIKKEANSLFDRVLRSLGL